jgi:hypothetical protein
MCPFIRSAYMDFTEKSPESVSFQTKLSSLSFKLIDIRRWTKWLAKMKTDLKIRKKNSLGQPITDRRTNPATGCAAAVKIVENNLPQGTARCRSVSGCWVKNLAPVIPLKLMRFDVVCWMYY